MGGGVSLIEGVEELMTTTIIIGRAISAMTFPGMFRIYDFHSKKAPRLKNARSFTFFAPDSEDDDDDEDAPPPNPADYEHFFKVVVNGDSIYIEDPLYVNDSGWTALHTCCMSLSTVKAGIELIEEMVRLGGSLETRTKFGPGTFNKGWTSLQMACAYGVDPLVEKLVEHGADVNATNSFGFSCLHEACHRGFADIVRHLIKGNVDLSYIPSEEDAMNSPFSSAPCQSALAEAARCGFYKIVQILLDAGAPKNLANKLGWTPLHEACFYHRIETVKTLLLAGADPTIRTKRGALPYHLAGLSEIRNMLESMGGPQAVPKENDMIDMLQVLTDLTMPELAGQDGSGSERSERDQQQQVLLLQDGAREMPVVVVNPKSSTEKAISNESQGKPSSNKVEKSHKQMKELPENRDELLHSGPMLGNLPNLTPSKASPTKISGNDVEAALNLDSKQSILGTSPTKGDDKKKKKKKKGSDEVPPDMPKEFLCQLTRKPMSEPMKTVYGNVYDKTAIMNWFSTQGRICPLTGAPLSEIELTPMNDLANQIRQWILKKSLEENVTSDDVHHSPVREANVGKQKAGGDNDDIYDF